MTIGDIVVVIDTEILPNDFLGRYGRVKNIFGDIVLVEFNKRVNNRGSLSHAAKITDLEKVV